MLQKRNPSAYIIPWKMEGGAWDVIWRLADEPGAYYIKIDDDVTWWHSGKGCMLPVFEAIHI